MTPPKGYTAFLLSYCRSHRQPCARGLPDHSRGKLLLRSHAAYVQIKKVCRELVGEIQPDADQTRGLVGQFGLTGF